MSVVQLFKAFIFKEGGLKKFKKFIGKMFKNKHFYFWQRLTCGTYVIRSIFKGISDFLKHLPSFDCPSNYPMHKKQWSWKSEDVHCQQAAILIIELKFEPPH